MFRCIRENVPCLPPELITYTIKHSIIVVVVSFFLTAAILYYTISNFSIDTDLSDMVSDDLPFRQIEKKHDKAFPQLSKTLDIVIDGQSPESAINAQKLLAQELLKKKDLFKRVFIPEGGEFFDKNGLLYMSVEELEELTDSLAEAQPMLAILSRDWSLSGFFSALNDVVHNADKSAYDNTSLILLLESLRTAFDSTMKNQPFYVSWQEIMLGRKVEKSQLRRFIIVQPVLDYTVLYAGEKVLDSVKTLIKDLNLNEDKGVRVRITGAVALNHDDLVSVEKGIGVGVATSLILLFVVLYLGMRSLRMIIISLVTLNVGLIWTTGFAIAFIGSLNLLSVTFAVLFIGLGIDYSIQYCMRYRELVESGGYTNSEAISTSAQSVVNALYLCCITTAVGFYAFVPTDYVGASELGIISGTGMLISLLTNVTLLPALLSLFPLEKNHKKPFSVNTRILTFPEKNAKPVVASVIILCLTASTLLPKVFFDYNPLNLSDQKAESVRTAQELFTDEKIPPWTISVLASNRDKARSLAESLSKLKEVDRVLFIDDFVPDDQEDKSFIIEDMDLFVPPLSVFESPPSRNDREAVQKLKDLETSLQESLNELSDVKNLYTSALSKLFRTVKEFTLFLKNSEDSELSLKMLEKRLLPNLSIMLNNFGNLLYGEPFEESDLPDEIRERYVSEDGQYRVEVFPKENINDIHLLERFVSSVRTITPEANDAPVTMLESGNAIFSASLHAFTYALTLIVIFLYMVFKEPVEIVLVIIPIIMSLMLTSVVAALLGIPYNFANIIVIPLTLGIGVDYSIHIIYCFRTEPLTDHGVLGTSTARAVLFSALTTIVSFGSLSILDHQGIASLGKLLTLSMVFIILFTLVVLPALLKIFYRANCKR